MNTAIARARVVSERPPRENVVAPARLQYQAAATYEFADVVELPGKARITVYLLALLLLAAIIWGAVAQVDVVVQAEGKIATGQQLFVVQPLELSVVRSIAVKIGDEVKVGQTLATLDRTSVQADVSDATVRVAASRAVLDRISVEMAGREYDPAAPNEAERSQRDIYVKRKVETAAREAVTRDKIRDLESQLSARQTEMQHLAHRTRLSIEAERIYQELFSGGLGSKLKLIDAQRASAEAQGKIIANEGEQQSLKEQIQTAKSELTGYLSERIRKLADEYAQASVDYNDAATKLAKATMRNDFISLKSPIDGTVLELADRDSGSVVREAETLITLVPKSAKFMAELHVETRDIARLKVGQQVRLKLESLPYQQFGYLEGRLTTITPDTLVDDTNRQGTGAAMTSHADKSASGRQVYYRVRVELAANKLRNLPEGFALRPGMRVTANINVGERSILEYVFNPITRALNDSLREP